MRFKSNFLFVLLIYISSGTSAFGQDTLKIDQFEMNSCIVIYSDQQETVLTNDESFNALIGKTGDNTSACFEMVKEFDFNRFSLIGVNINSGYCRVPMGLNFNLVKVEEEKLYKFTVSYIEPIGQCRALSMYNLWVKVPSIPDDYDVDYVIDLIPR